MMHPIATAFAQIMGTNGSTVGSGFLLGDRTICTCAHVYAQAIGQPELKLSPNLPTTPISLTFPFLSPQIHTAEVRSWSPDQPNGCDAALLSVRTELPRAARELPILLASDATGSPFEVHGFQTGTSFDINAKGHIGARNARGWYELIGDTTQGFFIQPGFSGGPVWDVARQVCIGIIKAVANDPVIRVAFLVPSESLIRRLPGYKLSNNSSRGLVFDKHRYELFVGASRGEPTAREKVARHLSQLISHTEDPTERYWIYEALGDVSGEIARSAILKALAYETDEFARRGAESAACSLSVNSAALYHKP